MRSLLNVGLITFAGVFLAPGNMIGQSNGETPVVNITPRPRSPAGKAETGPRANIRVDTTLVPIPRVCHGSAAPLRNPPRQKGL